MSIVDKELTTIALCWRLERRDGVALGLTGHDRDLRHDGMLYRAAPGMLPSAITLSDGFDADSLDVAGALSSDAISERDLAAGRWDGARVEVLMLDWEQPDLAPISLVTAELGDISMRGVAFEAELRGAPALLERGVVEQTSPACRASLGDRRCRVDMAARTRLTRVAAVIEAAVIDVDGAPAGNAWGYGRLRWIGGSNSGLESAIAASDGTRLTLREPPHFVPGAGDLIEIAEGCDKTFETCTGRFANAVNFRGEPHLPGLDLLTRYPGA